MLKIEDFDVELLIEHLMIIEVCVSGSFFFIGVLFLVFVYKICG